MQSLAPRQDSGSRITFLLFLSNDLSQGCDSSGQIYPLGRKLATIFPKTRRQYPPRWLWTWILAAHDSASAARTSVRKRERFVSYVRAGRFRTASGPVPGVVS